MASYGPRARRGAPEAEHCPGPAVAIPSWPEGLRVRGGQGASPRLALALSPLQRQEATARAGERLQPPPSPRLRLPWGLPGAASVPLLPPRRRPVCWRRWRNLPRWPSAPSPPRFCGAPPPGVPAAAAGAPPAFRRAP
ncbi:unnamed protein product [Prorocentrum cordatum]|uniref:Uncharacterized protein n=1 Tax=Prorocentrum cordatum TaxID=2364126 RepID=A0ABN9WYU0_9DINO|nr:unnamed protein product [Polarella glacialis]